MRIGIVDPTTGSNASTGQDTENGSLLAAEIVNGKHPDIALPLAKGAGLPNLGGAKLKMITADSKGDPTTGASEAQRLITDQKVVAELGSYQSAVTTTASAAAERLKVPFVNGASSSVSLTQRGLNYFFRTGPHDLTFGESFFSLLKDKPNGRTVKNIAILHTNDAFGTNGAKVTEQLAQNNNFTVVKDIGYPVDATNLDSQVQQIKAANPDALFVLSFVADSIVLSGTFKKFNYLPPAVLGYGAGFSDPAFVKGAENAANAAGFIRRTSWSPDIAAQNPTAEKIAQMFQKQFGAPMTENSARSFTAALTLAMAINNAKSTDPNKIRAALQNINVAGRDTIMPWDGVKFDENHQNSGARGVLEQFLGGAWHVIYPKDVATKQVVWPIQDARK
ncbi:MAG TPA: ABC transporter substrate-binding protein [Mycobacteriales bacterium]|nr:ABC transporter substrate-binding protein [Mycobacteriales bacterium]